MDHAPAKLNVAAMRYTTPAILIHWLMAIGLISLFGFGLYMSDLPLSPEKLRFYSWHKWAGVSLFLLALVRLSWRIGHRPPALPAHMARNEQLIAHAGHAMLYLLMLAIPLSGWLMSSARGFQTVMFGLWPIPDLLSKDKELGELLKTVHWALNMTLAATALGHALAALKHHFINRDDVLTRMSLRQPKP